jgi:protein TonB
MRMRLTAFVLLSAALHAALLLVPSSQQQHRIVIGTPYRITIVPGPAMNTVQQQTETPPVAATPVAAQAETAKSPVARPVITATHDAPVSQPQQPASSSKPEREADTRQASADAVTASEEPLPQSSNQAVSAQQATLLRGHLEQAFRMHFFYPRLAVKRGWQGEVTLGLHVAANGVLGNIHIINSSGHNILDRAALDSLGKVKRLPEAEALLNGHALELALPVQYRLL